MKTDFRSDNTLGCSPEVIEALQRANSGSMTSYGNDEITKRLHKLCSDLFETEVDVFPMLTGTAANALSIAALTPPWGAVFCHEDAHIQRDELGAPEFYSQGAKLIPIAGKDGKFTSADLDRHIVEVRDSRRQAVPACVSVTQATEAGTVYTLDELRAITEVARRHGVRVQMDGARFANAAAATGASPADLTWRAGVDVLVLGGTKNGAMNAEVIVIFERRITEELAIRWHRGGHRLSKMRFLSAQLEAYLSNGLWMRNARHANAMAARIREGLSVVKGIEIMRPVDANIVFIRFPERTVAALQNAGFLFQDWPIFGAGACRIVTGFSTAPEDVDRFVAAVSAASHEA